MTDIGRQIEDADLLAFADGKLAPQRRALVDAWLAAHPDKAAEVFAWERQNEALAALYNPIAAERIPARLDPHLLASRARRPAWTLAGMAAAALVLLMLGAGGGYLAREVLDPPETPSAMLIDSAVAAHALYVKENRHAVEVAADDKQLITWLSNRIRVPIDKPDLVAEGFNLVGGRLLPADTYANAGPAAQLMYENAAAERLTVYITAALPGRAPAYEFATVAGLEAFYWANAQITCTVVGDLPKADMQMVAKKVYQQLTRRPDPGYPHG